MFFLSILSISSLRNFYWGHPQKFSLTFSNSESVFSLRPRSIKDGKWPKTLELLLHGKERKQRSFTGDFPRPTFCQSCISLFQSKLFTFLSPVCFLVISSLPFPLSSSSTAYHEAVKDDGGENRRTNSRPQMCSWTMSQACNLQSSLMLSAIQKRTLYSTKPGLQYLMAYSNFKGAVLISILIS